MKLEFDELHEPESTTVERSMPYEQYFGEMDLTPEQKKQRIEMANRFEDMMLFFFALLSVTDEYSYTNDLFIIEQIEAMYMTVLQGNDVLLDNSILSNGNNQLDTLSDGKQAEEISPQAKEYIRSFAKQLLETTKEHIGKDNVKENTSAGNDGNTENSKGKNRKENANDRWYTSPDRARFVAENEANTSANRKENEDAIKKGYNFKTWRTKRDLHVRPTHSEVDGLKIPVEDAFLVGNSEMMFPKDTSLGASAEEIVNCRCTIKYSKN